ncbi:MAG: ABC transporter transmembrane domain-containing protein [Pseudomonadota bacterium]
MSLPPLTGSGRGYSIAGVALLGVTQAVCAGAAAFATRDLFAALHNGGAAPIGAVALLLGSGFAMVAARIAARVLAEDLGQRYANALRSALYKHLSGTPARLLQNRRLGALGLRFVGDLSAARLWIGNGLCRLIAAGAILPGAALALFMLSPALALTAFTPLVIGLAVAAITAWRLEARHRDLRSKRASLAILSLERLESVAQLDLIGRTRTELKLLKKRGEGLRRSAVARARAVAWVTGLMDTFIALAGAVLFLTAFTTSAAPAQLAAALAMLAILAQPLRELAHVWDRRCSWIVARDKCERVFNDPTISTRTATSARSKNRTAPIIRLEKLLIPPLHALNEEVQSGERIALKGGSSDHHSHLLSVLAGMDAPPSGAVRLMSPDTRGAANRDEYRFGYISPEPLILRGSFRRALCLAAQKRPADSSLERLVEAFGLGETLRRVGGWDGRVESRGRNLLRYERRRLQLAQVALQAPNVLILDAPRLDFGPDGALLVLRLFELCRATTLFATEDATLHAAADRIWRLDEKKSRFRS